MTDHFYSGEGWEKEADHQFLKKTELQPASFSQPSHHQQNTVIASEAKQSADNNTIVNFVIGKWNYEAIC
jgi:hypothetical protein